MLNDHVLAVLGIVVSIAFGLWGVMLGLRKRKYPGEITFIKDRNINLFNDIVRNIKNLSISYKDENISNNIVLLKGHIINSGTKDITPGMIGQDLVAELPEDYKWVEVKIINCSPNLKAESIIESNTSLKFVIGLFRCNEFCSFEALAEVPIANKENKKQNKNISDRISWSHRIADTNKIKKQNITTTNESKKLRMFFLGYSFFMVIFSLGMFIMMNFVSDEKIRYHLNYIIMNEENKSVEVRILPQNNQYILIKGVRNEFNEIMKLDDFIDKYKPIPKIRMKKIAMYFNGFMLVMAALFFLVMFIQVKIYYKERRFLKLLDSKKDELSYNEPNHSIQADAA